jgi:alpha-tubulin suppressor-like RCC1 family protein
MSADETIISFPSEINLPNKDNLYVNFRKASLGSRHTALIDENMNLYMFGWNKYKQLLIDNVESCNQFAPVLIGDYKNRVLDVKCGTWFTLILVNGLT